MKVVIVGAGMAAARLADALPGHDVTLLGDEPYRPYNRILLSAVLEGTHAPDSLTLPMRDVDLRLDARVVEIHRADREVELADTSRVGYDVLVLATGSVPTLPPIRGIVRVDGRLDDRVHAFRSLADCRRLDAAVSAALLHTLFTPTTPLHDGAVILCNGRVAAGVAPPPSSWHVSSTASGRLKTYRRSLLDARTPRGSYRLAGRTPDARVPRPLVGVGVGLSVAPFADNG